MSLQTADNSAFGGASVSAVPSGMASAAGTPVNSGDGTAAVNPSLTTNPNANREKPTGLSNAKKTAGSGDSAVGRRFDNADKPTPKSTSEAINRATERYRRKISAYEQREQRVTELLRSAGFDTDLETAVAQLQTSAQNISREKSIRSRIVTRDYEILGDADADEIIKSGDVDSEIKRLEAKPVPLRTRRDRQCYLRLVNEQQSRRDISALGQIGVDVEKLKKDGAFAAFDNNLNPEIPVAQRYELYKKYCVMKKAVKPPVSAASRGNTPKREFFDPDAVDGMSREEISANLDAITKSMKNW